MIVCAVQNFVHTVAVNDFASMSLHDRIGGRPFFKRNKKWADEQSY